MASDSNTNVRAQWAMALQHLRETEAAYRRFLETVWRPAHEREDAFVRSHGLISPPATCGYFERRNALLSAHPLFAMPREIDEELIRLETAFDEAQTALMKLEAPDLAALRWKLEHVFDLEDTDNSDGGSVPSWTATYVLQTITDYRRLLPEAA